MRDLASNIGIVLALSPAVQAATIKGVAVDLQNFESAALVLSSGAVAGSGDYTAKMQESETTTDGDFTDVPADLLTGALPASLTPDGSFKQSYIGHKRYVRVVVTKNSGTSVAVGAIFVLGHHPPARPVRSIDLLAESIDEVHTVWLALNADAGLIDDGAIEAIRNTLYDAMERLRILAAAG